MAKSFVICTLSLNTSMIILMQRRDSGNFSRQSCSSDSGSSQQEELLYPNLGVLDVSHNNLTNVPADICRMTQLSELKVASNKLKEVCMIFVRFSTCRFLGVHR